MGNTEAAFQFESEQGGFAIRTVPSQEECGPGSESQLGVHMFFLQDLQLQHFPILTSSQCPWLLFIRDGLNAEAKFHWTIVCSQ